MINRTDSRSHDKLPLDHAALQPPSPPSPPSPKHRDPVTGDALTGGEYVSWKIQGVIRRWTFLIIITLVTALVWATNNGLFLTWWNLGASYLALVIESVVGIAMFSQTKRDAVALREVRAMAVHIEKQDELILQALEHLDYLVSATSPGEDEDVTKLIEVIQGCSQEVAELRRERKAHDELSDEDALVKMILGMDVNVE